MYALIIRLRSALLVFLTHSMALPLLKFIRQPEVFPYSREELIAFENGSLGNDLVRFIDQKHLELLPYYARHDIKHILLGYNTTDDGEVCLQCFMLGNGHISFPVMATVFYGMVTMPEHWCKFRNAFRRGRKACSLESWNWFELLKTPTETLRNKIDNV